MTRRLLKGCLLAVLTTVMSGCQFAPEDETCIDLGLPMPEGIVYEGHTYWEDEDVPVPEDMKEIGKAKGSPSCNVFPEEDFMVTKSAEGFIGKPVYQKENILYSRHDKDVRAFVYHTEMDVQKEIKECKEADCSAYKPHFVYKGMEYWLYENIYDITTLPKDFQYVGELRQVVYRAGSELSGASMQEKTKLYGSKHQNRFMLAEQEDGTLTLFENKAYQKENSIKES